MAYCFYWGWPTLTAEDWSAVAAWVQAVGSLGAIAAVLLPWWLERREATKQRNKSRLIEQRSATFQALRTLLARFPWMTDSANAPNTPWGHLVDPFGQYAADPGSSSYSLGPVVGPAFETFIERCEEAWQWCQAMSLRDPNNQDRQSVEARKALAKIQSAFEAAVDLRAKLYTALDIEPPPPRN